MGWIQTTDHRFWWGPIEFVIPESGEDYCDLSETYLLVTAKITKPGGTSLQHGTEESPGPDAGIGPVNLWLHSLFSQVDLSLNERLVTMEPRSRRVQMPESVQSTYGSIHYSAKLI